MKAQAKICWTGNLANKNLWWLVTNEIGVTRMQKWTTLGDDPTTTAGNLEKQPRLRRQLERYKAIARQWLYTCVIHHTFWYISLPFSAKQQRKISMVNFLSVLVSWISCILMKNKLTVVGNRLQFKWRPCIDLRRCTFVLRCFRWLRNF